MLTEIEQGDRVTTNFYSTFIFYVFSSNINEKFVLFYPILRDGLKVSFGVNI